MKEVARAAEKEKEDKAPPANSLDAARRALEQLSGNPLSSSLLNAKMPSRIKHDPFILYDSSADPVGHIRHYQQQMFMHTGDDVAMCVAFPSSLGPVALTWFHKLESGSIRSWTQLKEEFVARFLTSRVAPKTFEHLTAMKQGQDEPLREYAKKFWETYNEIDHCSPEFAIATFKTGLPVRGKLRESLTFEPVTTIAQMMERIEKHVRCEDEISRETAKLRAQKPKSPTRRGGNAEQRKDYPEQKKEYNRREYGQDSHRDYQKREGRPYVPPDPKSFFAVNTMFKDPIYRLLPQIKDEPWFRWPTMRPEGDWKDRKATNERCSYHRDWGHMTENCQDYKRFLEDKVKEGLLDNFIQKSGRQTGKRAEGAAETAYDKPPRKVVSMIQGMAMPNTKKEVRLTRRQAGSESHVLSLQGKRPRADEEKEYPINFTEADLVGVTLPHNDALVVTLRVDDCDLKNILVSDGVRARTPADCGQSSDRLLSGSSLASWQGNPKYPSWFDYFTY